MTQATTTPVVPKSLSIPPNASVFQRQRITLHALSVLKDDPGNPYYAPLLHASLDTGTYARLARQLRETVAGRRMLDEQPTMLTDIDLDALAKLPEGTLGHEFAHYFRKNGIEPFSFDFPLRSDADFLNKRYRETHDIHHLLTGYGTDPTGEIELQAFYVGNLRLIHAALIMALSIPHQLTQTGLDVRRIRGYVRRMRAAYVRGKHSRELLSVKFEELWSQPVSKLSAMIRAPVYSAEA